MSIDLTDVDTLKYAIRSSRTGSNIKIGIRGTTETTVTYYFDGWDEGGEEWYLNPVRMVDGNINTNAFESTDGIVQLCNSNTSDGTDLGIITKVELRAHFDDRGSGHIVYLRPVFGGGDGDNHTLNFVRDAWTNYFDITSDTNAPGTWSWANVDDLNCDVELFDKKAGVGPELGKVEIRVTYTIITTTEHTANISSANAWEVQTWDISGVSNANKDAIDRIIVTIVNADAANTFYIDDFYGVSNYTKNFTDDVATLSEPTYINGVSRIMLDAGTLSEPSFVKGLSKNLTETTTLSEVFQRSLSLVRWTETATLTEVAQKAIALIILEIATLSEVLQKAIGQNPVETATLSEIFSRALSIRRWTETATVTDILSKGTTKAFVDDVFTLTEAINKWHLPAAKTTVWTKDSAESGMWTKEEAGIEWNQL